MAPPKTRIIPRGQKIYSRWKKARVPRGIAASSYGENSPHRFKRTVRLDNITLTQTTAGYFKGFDFNLGMLPNYTEFTLLFDQYKIDKVKLKLVPTFSTSDILNVANHGSGTICPNVQSILDFNDSTNPVTENELLQYANRKLTRGTREHSRKFAPRFASAEYKTVLAFGYRPAKGYLNTVDYNVPHYGMKVYIDEVTGAQASAWLFRVYAEFWVTCKGIK